MIRLLLVVVAIVVATIFATDNMHRVPISFVVGQPVHMRLFFVMMTCFLAGCLAAILWRMYWGVVSSRRLEDRPRDSTEEDFHFS